MSAEKAQADASESLRRAIRDVPDFPTPGIVFKDITPLLADPSALQASVELLAERSRPHRPDAIAAIESRGFIFGAALASTLSLPLQLVRKPGKLPYKTVGVSYELEYGDDRVEIHEDAVRKGQRFAVVDDLVATGGTAAATGELLAGQGGVIACFAFVVELTFLRGRDALGAGPVETLVRY